jgi:hypothetical protein
MQTITADLSKLPSPSKDELPAGRVETGALQINGDWPGIYIRGDDALYYAMQLSRVLGQLDPASELVDIITVSSLKSLVDTLRSCAIIDSEEENLTRAVLDLDDLEVGC